MTLWYGVYWSTILKVERDSVIAKMWRHKGNEHTKLQWPLKTVVPNLVGTQEIIIWYTTYTNASYNVNRRLIRLHLQPIIKQMFRKEVRTIPHEIIILG